LELQIVNSQSQELKELAQENQMLRDKFEVQQTQYLELVNKTREHADLLFGNPDSVQVENEGEVQQSKLEMRAQIAEQRERIHLLTEENHVIFE